MSDGWNTVTLTTETETFDLLAELRGKLWLCRGQSKNYGQLVPSIDREARTTLSRLAKLKLERQSINLFRESARFCSHPGEMGALKDDNIALMVLRHYEVPTRLLDWSGSPHVAAYFAACNDDAKDGEIWSFDRRLYEEKGKAQWKKWPETTRDGSGDDTQFAAELTMFTREEPPDWFICLFYPSGFPRQNAQDGAYTLTARFGRDHAEAIARLLEDKSRYSLYRVPPKLKPTLRRLLREQHGIWQGSLFPDFAGAAKTAMIAFSE
jgi:FRG domain